ncbi:GNAT family N-acetyltransferase [Streptomyces sp. NPDC007369]|uniref:GNAT family N-acetyltransferase n=1 Tax=Streptomyces sp. NPDC007369 TaxID=3154589 RepID=UPI0033F11913
MTSPNVLNNPSAATDRTPVRPDYPVRTGRLALRPVRSGDLDAIHAHRSLPEVAKYLPHEPHTREATRQTLERMTAGEALAEPGGWLDLAVETETGRVVGEVLLKRDGRAPLTGEIGFAFHPDVHGTGIPTEAVSAALDLAFDTFGWHRVFGVCNVQNTASAALMRRVGMRHEAVSRQDVHRKGTWHSTSQYAVLAAERRRTRPCSADEKAVDARAAAFYAAFTRSGGGPVDLAAARAVLAPDALIERVAEDGSVDRMDVDAFLAPREALLNGPELTEFTEVEVAATTLVADGRATRSGQYFKWGVRDGVAFSAWGRKTFRLSAASGTWLIESLTWTDEPETGADS